MKLIEIKRTCWMCPSQWEGKADDNRWVYFRYRHGCLRIEVGKEGIGVDDDKFFDETETIFEEYIGGQYDGYMTFRELKSLTKHIIKYKAKEDGIIYLPFWKEFYKEMKEYDLCGSLTTTSSKKTFVTVLKKAASMLAVIALLLAVALSLLLLLSSTSTAPVEENVMLKNSLKIEGWK